MNCVNIRIHGATITIMYKVFRVFSTKEFVLTVIEDRFSAHILPDGGMGNLLSELVSLGSFYFCVSSKDCVGVVVSCDVV